MRSNYIYKQIRRISMINMAIPVILTIVLLVIYINFPILEILTPMSINSTTDIDKLYSSNVTYIDITFDSLYYSGYDYIKNGKTLGYYYYSFANDKCTFVLVGSKNLKNPKDSIKGYSMKASIEPQDNLIKQTIADFSKDINWTPDGLLSASTGCYISEISSNTTVLVILGVSLLLSSIALLSYILSNILYAILPGLFPACAKFKKIEGSLKGLIRANLEMKNPNYVLFEYGNMIVTKRYFIYMSTFNFDIIPIDKIERVEINLLFIHKSIRGIHFYCTNNVVINLPYLNDDEFSHLRDFFYKNDFSFEVKYRT